MQYDIEFEQEEDGRWIAEIVALPDEAESRVEAMALRVIADRIERDKTTMSQVHFAIA
jgi:hypothetical protein